MIPVLGALVGWELGLVVLLIFVFFGGTLLPKWGRSIGQLPRGVRRGREEGQGRGPDRAS